VSEKREAERPRGFAKEKCRERERERERERGNK
jgi:hypothetical protein